MKSVSALLSEVRNCNICTNHLPFPPRPVLQLHTRARILIVGQAPGRKVHDSGIPFADMSGNRLRQWLGVSSEVFYDPCVIAILPMGLCFPGTGNAGDLPPRPECVPAWREKLMKPLKNLKLTLVLGKYAQAYYFLIQTYQLPIQCNPGRSSGQIWSLCHILVHVTIYGFVEIHGLKRNYFHC